MKRKSILFSALAVALLLTAFGAGTAYATTGCFTDTNGHWAETFICWMKDEGITGGTGGGLYQPEGLVTRGQMAVFMKAQADVPPSKGDIYINAGLNDWVPNGTSSHVEYFTNVVELHAPAAGIYGFQITPDLPASLYGRQIYFHSVKLCYDATHGATLTSVSLRHYTGGANPSIWHEITDDVDRTDKTCREYVITNGSLWGSDHIVLFIQGSFTSASDQIWISATTFSLVPSTSSGVLSPEEAIEPRPEMDAPQSLLPGESGQ